MNVDHGEVSRIDKSYMFYPSTACVPQGLITASTPPHTQPAPKGTGPNFSVFIYDPSADMLTPVGSREGGPAPAGAPMTAPCPCRCSGRLLRHFEGRSGSCFVSYRRFLAFCFVRGSQSLQYNDL